MEYIINHLDRRCHAIKENLWLRLLNLLENEITSEDVISKFEVVIEEFNDIEKTSFMNNPIYYDFKLSYSQDEIRVSEGLKGKDFIVISIFST